MTDWVLHDYLQVNGGAERLVITLASGLRGLTLGVSGIYPDFARSGNLQGISPVCPAGISFLPRLPRAVASFVLPHFDLRGSERVIYSGIFAPLAVHRQRGGRRIYYCHTPPRFAFGETEAYLERAPAAMRPALLALLSQYRQHYLRALERMDVILCNSQHVSGKLAALGFPANVVYPPADPATFAWQGQADYYLSVARLEPNKRVDKVIAAFRAMPDKRLLIASGGSQLAALRALAGSATNIEFTGWQDDQALGTLIGRATAVIYVPRDEDFGMSAIEAMAAGKPVIAANEGGLRESVVDGRTGRLIAPTSEAIIETVRWLDQKRAVAMRRDCEARATAFSRQRFLKTIASYL